MNGIITDMLYDLGGHPRYHASIFPAAAAILRKIVQKECNNVLMNAMVCQEEMKLDLDDSKTEDEHSFENPYEDITDLQLRRMAGLIILQDKNGDCRMPFGLPV